MSDGNNQGAFQEWFKAESAKESDFCLFSGWDLIPGRSGEWEESLINGRVVDVLVLPFMEKEDVYLAPLVPVFGIHSTTGKVFAGEIGEDEDDVQSVMMETFGLPDLQDFYPTVLSEKGNWVFSDEQKSQVVKVINPIIEDYMGDNLFDYLYIRSVSFNFYIEKDDSIGATVHLRMAGYKY